MISRQLVTHFLSRSFFSASPEFVCQNCQKCQATRGAKKSVKSVNFALSGEGVPVPGPVSATGSQEFVCQNCQKCQATRGAKKSVKSVNFAPSSSMFCVGYRQPGICLSKLSKVSNDPGGEKERQKRFCSLWGGCSSSMFCVGYRQPEICLSKLSKVSNDLGAKKSVRSVNFALSGEGVPVPCSVSATGLVSRHGSEFDISQACRFCNVRAGAQAISGAQKCLQRASKRL